jgi:hypothetical protein
MSDKLMDTEPGGERQNQYEGVHTFVEPHAKQAGQLGGMLFPFRFTFIVQLLTISSCRPLRRHLSPY